MNDVPSSPRPADRLRRVLASAPLLLVLLWYGHRALPQVAALLGFESSVGSAEETATIGYVSLGGETLQLADMRGSVVVLAFWATWCRECGRHMPALERLQEEYGRDDVRVLAVSIDRGGEEAIRSYVRRFDLTYWIGRDRLERGSQLAVSGVPTTFLIDRTGVIRHRLFGPLSRPALFNAVRRLVEEVPIR